MTVRPKLGSRGVEEWLDVSDYLVHFSKGEDGYDIIMSILGSRTIKRGDRPFGCASNRKSVDMESQRVVCLSEIPLGFLQRLVERRGSSYGIGFHKRFVLGAGGAPVWYAERGSGPQKAISRLMSVASTSSDELNDIWNITPFIDFPTPEPYRNDFRWEREWRVRSDLSFKEENVAFLFLPEKDHEAAWSFFDDARNTNIGPGYFCPYIDAKWPVERVQVALRESEERHPPPLRPRPW